MINIFKITNTIALALSKMKDESKIVEDYRVALRGGLNLYACILNASDEAGISQEISNIYPKCNIEFLDNGDLEDSFYTKLFSDKTPYITIDKGRRRFDALLDTKETEKPHKTPVMTFYSYKGGMGRSTTLAAFAIHLARNEYKKVFIIDCDFEAPGFSNFYLENPGTERHHKGFVEYILDKQLDSNIELEGYNYEAKVEYGGAGSIRVMPAGSLGRYVDETTKQYNTNDFLKDDLHHYLEGFARIDFAQADYITKQFEQLVVDIENSYKPDVIIIDARTGFSDIMGVTAIHLSDAVVGFFRNDAQSMPGLYFFLEQTLNKHKNTEITIANSILPSNISIRRETFKRFQNDVDTISETIKPEEEIRVPCFPISRDENLEVLGTTLEETDIFVELIETKQIRDYKLLFEHLTKVLYDKNIVNSPISNTPIPTLKTAPSVHEINTADDSEKVIWRAFISKKILDNTTKKLNTIQLYAENAEPKKDFKNNLFFYRECMHSFFNLDTFLIIGGKGTGKSYMYKALNEKEMVEELQRRANKTTDNYTFFYTIDKTQRIFKVANFDSPTENFKNNFWLVYTWLILRRELQNKFSDYNSKTNIPIFEINNDNTTQSKLEELISNTIKIIAIEQDMKDIDTFLIQKGNGKKEYITLVYDQLDEIIQPEKWNNWLPSLLSFWQFKRYNRIFGKLFVRKDLFRKLRGVTNINDLENKSVDIEWSREELFAYFFKIVLSNDIDEWFWSLMYLNNTPNALIEQISNKYNILGQLPLDKYNLEPLVNLFFGEKADVFGTTKFGDSYSWFYKNLKNADDTISLRVFLELLKRALVKNTTFTKSSDIPILYQMAYTDRGVRTNAVKRHFEDLSKENGNKPLEYIFDYIDNNKSAQSITLDKRRFEIILSDIIIKYKDKKEMNEQTIESLTQLLVDNGIVKKENFGRGDVFKFAYLYKYRLGLKGN